MNAMIIAHEQLSAHNKYFPHQIRTSFYSIENDLKFLSQAKPGNFKEKAILNIVFRML